MTPGTLGVVVNPDNRAAARVYEGARVRVVSRIYFPDALIVELLDGSGLLGEIPLRYFEVTP